jgi:hypothetical protein
LLNLVRPKFIDHYSPKESERYEFLKHTIEMILFYYVIAKGTINIFGSCDDLINFIQEYILDKSSNCFCEYLKEQCYYLRLLRLGDDRYKEHSGKVNPFLLINTNLSIYLSKCLPLKVDKVSDRIAYINNMTKDSEDTTIPLFIINNMIRKIKTKSDLKISDSSCFERSVKQGGQVSYLRDIKRLLMSLSEDMEFDEMNVIVKKQDITLNNILNFLYIIEYPMVNHMENCIDKDCKLVHFHLPMKIFCVPEYGYKNRIVCVPPLSILLACYPLQHSLTSMLKKCYATEAGMNSKDIKIQHPIRDEDLIYSIDFSKATDNLSSKLIYEISLLYADKVSDPIQKKYIKSSMRNFRLIEDKIDYLVLEDILDSINLSPPYLNLEDRIFKYTKPSFQGFLQKVAISLMDKWNYTEDVRIPAEEALERRSRGGIGYDSDISHIKKLENMRKLKDRDVQCFRRFIIYHRKQLMTCTGPLQKRGLHMSTPLSFSTLCLVHISVCILSKIKSYFIMGDDAVLICNSDQYWDYQTNIQLTGMALNHEKTFISRNSFLFCEKLYVIDNNFVLKRVDTHRMKKIYQPGGNFTMINKDCEDLITYRLRYWKYCWEMVQLSFSRYDPLVQPEFGGLGYGDHICQLGGFTSESLYDFYISLVGPMLSKSTIPYKKVLTYYTFLRDGYKISDVILNIIKYYKQEKLIDFPIKTRFIDIDVLQYLRNLKTAYNQLVPGDYNGFCIVSHQYDDILKVLSC